MPRGVAVCTAFLVACCMVSCLPREKLYPHGDGLDLALPRDQDEASSPEITLLVPIIFYGETYTSAYINSNGLLSFLTEIPSFFNIQFPLDYPVIAPLYTNVDTRASGVVYYRETQDPSLLERATGTIRDSFTSGRDFTAKSLFIATWVDVGYHDRGADKVNTYQLVVASSGSDSYVELLYPDGGIQWIQGSGQASGLPDARAQAGLVSGDGRLYTLRGSGTDQVQHLDKWSNTGIPGQWMFHIGQIDPNGNVMPPDTEIQGTPSTVNSCSQGSTACHSKSHCIDYSNTGFCCVCQDGYYGNGLTCLKDDIPLRVNGKLNGEVNDIKLSQLELQSYVVTSDGRTYTAISRVPEEVGYDLQVLSVLGGVIGWLFAKRINGAINGYQLTGGLLNHTVDIVFPLGGQKVSIHQRYLGLDVFDHLRMEAEIRGTLPAVPPGSKVQLTDYEEQYTRVGPGLISSRSSLTYRHDGSSVEFPFNVEQTIMYNECQYSVPNITSLRLKVARNFISYEARESILRYAMTDKVTPPGEVDPCRDGRAKCGQHSSCRVDGDTFKCVCHQGYHHLYEETDGDVIAVCVDINECSTGTHDCDINAHCVNEPGRFSCLCKGGFTGDGHSCQKLLTCDDLRCPSNSECIEIEPGNLKCQCLPGYVGDGIYCSPISQESCDMIQNCSPFGVCTVDAAGEAVCVCLPGYEGDGYTCTNRTDEQTTEGSPSPSCVLGYCWCPTGYDLQDSTCVRNSKSLDLDDEDSQLSCNIVNNCHPHAQCIFSSQRARYQCHCNAGYEGDGYECAEIDVSCLEVDLCGVHAYCHFDDSVGKAVCMCNSGYQGDGIFCSPADECSAAHDCGTNALCQWSNQQHRFECVCSEGYVKEGTACVLKQGSACNVLKNCDHNAQCLLDFETDEYRCVCNAGYSGNGQTCEVDRIGCNILNNCGPGAECLYDKPAGGFRCRCKQGFHGDGLRCRPDTSCRDDPSLCHHQASCVLGLADYYICECNEGFTGNGAFCRAVSQFPGNFLLVNQGMTTLRIPFKPTKRDLGRPIAIQYSQIAIGIDIDCLSGRVYWADATGKSIKSSNYDGSNVTTFLSLESGSPEGVSVDWVSRNIYWTDSSKDTLEVANLDTKLRKVLVSEGLVNPRGIAVHPARGKVFWSDWNRNAPKLEWANLDGTDRRVFLEGSAVRLPNSLAIDWQRDELCWADAGTKAVECIGIGSSFRRSVASNCSYPFGLAISQENYYWTDWDTKRIESAQRPSGKPNKPILVPFGGSGKLYGIVAVPEQCERFSTACQFDNGHCGTGHLCLPNGSGGRSCVCADSVDDEGSGEAPICNDI